jgi:hypothetical protein
MISVSFILSVMTLSAAHCNFYSLLYRITNDVDVNIRLENFLSEVTNPILENVRINYCDHYQNSEVVTTAMDKTFFYGSENIIAGKLLEEGYTITLEGTSASGRVSRKITIPAILNNTSSTVTKKEPHLKRLWASLKIKNSMQQFLPFSNLSVFENAFENQNQILHNEVLEEATKYNLVTYLTPFIATIINEDDILSAEPYLLEGGPTKETRVVIK